MSTKQRQELTTTAFLPMPRTIDRRAEYYLRQFDHAQSTPPKVQSNLPPLIVEAVTIWTLVGLALLWLAHCYGWIA
jgi:hypothetical protein